VFEAQKNIISRASETARLKTHGKHAVSFKNVRNPLCECSENQLINGCENAIFPAKSQDGASWDRTFPVLGFPDFARV
jgi:hypothetical protein